MSAPRVSVLMPAYNHERFVTQAVESVWGQSAGDVELIVIDDGSTDSTPEVLKRLAARSPIPMSVEVQANAGISSTLNRALAKARGEWICVLASDDFYAADFVRRHLEVAGEHGRQDVVQHCDAFLVEHDDLVTGTIGAVSDQAPLEGQAFELLATAGGWLLPCSMFLPRALLESVGGFDPKMVAEDYDLQLRLARIAEFRFIDEPLVDSRYTPGSLGKQPWRFGDSIIASLLKHSDALGDRLPEVLRDRCLRISRSCFEYGRPGYGLRWAGRALGHARGAARKWKTAGDLAAIIPTSLARFAAMRLFPRQRLVTLKRRLRPSRGQPS
jgi:glycosyltransferase involved in cell wall biosynthesis